MTDNIIGYRKTGKDSWEPIYDIQRGMIATAAIMSCSNCHTMIRSSGGPGYNCICPTCYETQKMVDFISGIKHNGN